MKKNKPTKPRITMLNYQAGKDENPFTHKGPWTPSTAYKTKAPTWEIVKFGAKLDGKSQANYRCDYQFCLLATLKEEHSRLLTVWNKCSSRMEDPVGLDQLHPVHIYIDYPLSCILKITVHPSCWNKRIVERGIGYYIWTAAKVYADIYKRHHRKVGVWGHGFSDLFLEGFTIGSDNSLTFHIGS